MRSVRDYRTVASSLPAWGDAMEYVYCHVWWMGDPAKAHHVMLVRRGLCAGTWSGEAVASCNTRESAVAAYRLLSGISGEPRELHEWREADFRLASHG